MADLESQDADASIEVKVNDQGPFNAPRVQAEEIVTGAKSNFLSFEPKPVFSRKPKPKSHIMAGFRCTPRVESEKSNSPLTLPRPG